MIKTPRLATSRITTGGQRASAWQFFSLPLLAGARRKTEQAEAKPFSDCGPSGFGIYALRV